MDVPVFNVFSEDVLQTLSWKPELKVASTYNCIELSTCYKGVFLTWLQLTTIILAVQRQWMLNFTMFCPSIHNAYTYIKCIFICSFIIYNQVQEMGLHKDHDLIWAVLVQLLTSISSNRWRIAVYRLPYSFVTTDMLTSYTYKLYNTLWRKTFKCRSYFVNQQLMAVDYKMQPFLQVYKSRKLLFYPTILCSNRGVSQFIFCCTNP